MKKHVNIPIFIPHIGCPNQCVFCNQRTISGVNSFDISRVRYDIETALETIDDSQEAEIAFFGGSFTGIEFNLMMTLLKLANEYILCGRVKSIRCSTRPDYINGEILDILKVHNVIWFHFNCEKIPTLKLINTSVSSQGLPRWR